MDISPDRLYRELYRKLYRLNLAEAYGRSGDGDRGSFLETAEASAVKAAAFLDLCVSRGELPAEPGQAGLDLLGRVELMLRVLSGGAAD